MKYIRNIFLSLMAGMAILSLQACNGILEDIYDDPSEAPKSAYGFLKKSFAGEPGTIYIDASSYTRWIYINFHRFSIDSLNIDKGGEEYSGEWDIAIHRYDAKTLEGSVLETEFTDLKAFRDSGKMPEGSFTKDIDTDSTVIIDMSQMMEGNIGYVKSKVNLELKKWLDRDMSTMPPVYTLSNKVYLIRLKDGSMAAVKLVDFVNKMYDKGFLTIDYIYPIEF